MVARAECRVSRGEDGAAQEERDLFRVGREEEVNSLHLRVWKG